jgi:molecular chaperone GrpE
MTEKEELLNEESTNTSAQAEASTEATTEATVEQAETTSTEEPRELTVEEKLAEAEAKIEKLNNAMLYKVAEFENYRKRTIKEKADLILNGGEKTITSLLPVLDDLERAMQHMNDAADVAALREGVSLIINKLNTVLSEQGLKRIDTKDAEFTTDLHEAIAFIPAPSDDLKGKVIDCVQAGYMLNEKVIRYAKVAVGQ